MALVVHCRDVGLIVTVLSKLTASRSYCNWLPFAAEAHGLQEVTDDVVLKVKVSCSRRRVTNIGRNRQYNRYQA